METFRRSSVCPVLTGNILPQMTFGYGTVGSPNGVEIFHDTTIEAEDSITWTHGHHSVHAGFELYHYIMNDVYAGSNGAAGQFTFTGQYTGLGARQHRERLRGLPAWPAVRSTAG